jgi:hypothetical protein
MVVGADAIQAQAQRAADRIEELAEANLAEFLADDGSIEEVIGEKADMILWAVQRLREHRNAEAFLAVFDDTIRGHLEISARRFAERDAYVERRDA